MLRVENVVMSDQLTFLCFVDMCNLSHLTRGPQEALWNIVKILSGTKMFSFYETCYRVYFLETVMLPSRHSLSQNQIPYWKKSFVPYPM
jgi:hypothetical protein